MKSMLLTTAAMTLVFAGCGDSGRRPMPPAAPSIGAVPAQTISANVSSAPIAFSVQGEGNLSYSVSSDNPALIAGSNIDLVTTPTGGTLVITPEPDLLGDAMLTIMVTNAAELADATSFLATVVPQQLSFRDFSRTQFLLPTTAEGSLINAIAFDDDANGDAFADLLAP